MAYTVLNGSVELLVLKSQPLQVGKGVPGSSVVKNLPADSGGTVSIHESGRSPEEGNGILAWEIPWTEEPGRATVRRVTKESDTT